MILTRLYELYERLANDPDCAEKLAPFGSSSQKISFVVVLSPQGELIDIQDAKEQIERPPKKKGGAPSYDFKPRDVIVPGSAHPSGSAPTPRFLWDGPAYIFGYYPECAKKSEKDQTKAREKLFASFRELHNQVLGQYSLEDEGYKAVVAFLNRWNPDPSKFPEWVREKLEKYATNFGVFKIQGQMHFVHESASVQAVAEQVCVKDGGGSDGMCLISGKSHVSLVSTIDSKIKLNGTSVGGGAIASFNASAYESYGKEQTLNAPMSDEASFKAYGALNYLLANRRQNLKLADTTVVFWTEKKTASENILAEILGVSTFESNAAQDTAYLQKLEAFWKILRSSGDPDLSGIGDDRATRFYALGIAPNSARIVIRFWYENTLGDFVLRLREHCHNMTIEKQYDSQFDVIPLYRILEQTARDKDEIPPLLGHELLRSIICGLPYPASLYQLVLNRINVSSGGKDGKYSVGSKVSYERASIIKAFLIRNKNKGELTMSLNTDNTDPAYLLGRLFATLEKTQDESSGGVNAGIGDKYYSSASATPRIVFPTLLDLFRKHVQKLGKEKPGLAVVREKLVGEILDMIDSKTGFPANLSLEDRGVFALGYYQQMRALFKKKDAVEESTESESVNN